MGGLYSWGGLLPTIYSGRGGLYSSGAGRDSWGGGLLSAHREAHVKIFLDLQVWVGEGGGVRGGGWGGG